MRQCKDFDAAMSYDCAECDEQNCEFRKSGSALGTVLTLLFIVIVVALGLYAAVRQLGLTRQEIIEIILMLVFLGMASAFASLAAGRKDGDKQIIADLQKENDLLSAKNAELKRKIEKFETDRSQRVMNNLKLGSETIYKSVVTGCETEKELPSDKQ